ncbi:MAG: glutathione peroxidase [Glaciecola sp.]|jgi:glutathione peroxidase
MKYLAFITAVTLTIITSSMTSNDSTSKSIYDLQFISLEGDTIHLSTFKGKKILFVNVASKCGFTSQYKELQKLHESHKDDLVIIGFPCNQFGSQESGSESEIKTFCQKNYGVDFLMSAKIEVKGENQHPIYSWLTSKDLNGSKSSTVKWNFQKYLVDKQGGFIDYWYSVTSPTSSKITKHLK